jgi:hypothetical protein
MKNKIYYQNNKEYINEYGRQYYNDNKIERSQYAAKYRSINRDHLIKNAKIYRNLNRNLLCKKAKQKLMSDPLYRIRHDIRVIISQSFKKNKYIKPHSTEYIIGCSFKEFKAYIENKFEKWMNWNNKGNWNGISTDLNQSWDIDHIIPMSSANTIKDVLRLNHYTNLQPLCSYTNRWIKRDKLFI